MLSPLINDIDGQGKHNRCVLLDTYLRQSLQVTQLDRGGLCFENFRSVGKFLRGFELALRVNDLGAAFTFGFGLLGDGALHLLGNIDLLHFDFGDFDAPRLGVLVENDLKFGIHLIALRENFIELELPHDAAQRSLRELRRRVLIVLHLRHREVCVHNAEVTDGIHFHGDVVTRDDVLGWYIQSFEAQIDAIERLDRPKNQPQARSFGLGQQTAEPQDHAAFPLFDDVERIPEPDQSDTDDEREPNEAEFHVCLLNVTEFYLFSATDACAG